MATPQSLLSAPQAASDTATPAVVPVITAVLGVSRRHIRSCAWLVVLLTSAIATLIGTSPIAIVIRLVGLLMVTLLVMVIEMARRKDEIERAALLGREGAARAEVKAANDSKDDLFQTISHELRNPLDAILSWVYLLRSGKLNETAAVHALETIERNAKSEARLITDMLELSRIKGGKVHLDVQAIELATLIAEAAESVRPAADARDIHVEVGFSPPAGIVTGDPGRLHQVMANLLSNAIKFTPRGGRVAIKVVYDVRHATIRVRDTGRGIQSDFLPHVFERFRQANGTSPRLGGLGLGLAIVRHLVELHGGTVEAASEGDGRGSTFSVVLPIGPTAGTGSGSSAASRESTSSGSDRTIEMSRSWGTFATDTAS